MFGLYLFEDWNGNLCIMRASKIHKNVMDISKKTNYNWLTSAENLINVCNKKKFPAEYAIDIKVAILNCFAQLINNSHIKKEDLDAVNIAYNSLYKIQEDKAIKARTNFLNAFLMHITYHRFTFLLRGESYYNYCEKWRERKFKELFCEENLNFSNLEITLESDFENTILIADEKGIFSEDDKKEQLKIGEYIAKSTKHFEETYRKPEGPKVKTLK